MHTPTDPVPDPARPEHMPPRIKQPGDVPPAPVDEPIDPTPQAVVPSKARSTAVAGAA